VLEVTVACSKDGSITGMRAARAVRNAELLLAGLVNTSIHVLAVRPFYGHWVRLPGEDDRAAYLYPHYPCNLRQSTGDFSPAGALAPVVPERELFGPSGLSAGQSLSFPAGLVELLATYDALCPERQEQFLRSCYWLQRANRSFVESFSASFTAVVTAAEVLFEKKDPDVCRSCGQHRYGLRISFSHLLETLVPLAEITNAGCNDRPSFQARLKHLYDTRSQITHGRDLRGWDSSTHGFTPSGNRDDDDLRTLLRIMPFALGAWLSGQAIARDGRHWAPSLLERMLRWLAVRAGRVHTWLLWTCERRATRRSTPSVCR
jgi:hypothetical protein